MEVKIDLHVHSKMSGDTDSDPEECVIRAIERGLYGIAFTEHYSYAASEVSEQLREKYGNRIMIFRGIEFSAAEGHCLVFGMDTDRLVKKYAPVQELVRIAQENGGVIIPSHPFRGENSLGKKLMHLRGINALEGYNGCNLHAFNEKAVDTAMAMGLPYTGGSDAHDPAEVGSCYTLFQEDVRYDNFTGVLKGGRYRGIDTRKISRWNMWKGKDDDPLSG
ncbi:MAG: hypothetical protein A2X59_00540 [Nitrospirae bacterium GWC2_42_7]|nr:MAG: hypothetical protein A2X59_00540 [Nitrospirae bacterium GWC2_42_7]